MHLDHLRTGSPRPSRPRVAPVVIQPRTARFAAPPIAAPEGGPSRALFGLLALALCILAAAAAFVWRAEIVRLVPATARLYAAAGLPVNLRGLSLDAVRSVEEIDRGEAVLVVSGTITNVTDRAVEVPRLRLAISGAEPTVLYAWTARAPELRLAPGQSTGFRARLAAPPEAGRSVAVRFEDAPHARIGLR